MGKINDLKNQALATLKGKWASFVGLTFIFMLLMGIAQFLAQFGTLFQGSSFTTLAVVFTIIGVILTILMLPMQYGYYVAYLNSSRQDLPAEINDLFCGYRRFADVFITLLLQGLAVFGAMILGLVFIGVVAMMGKMEYHPVSFMLIAFLLMIPGFVLAIAYSMVPFILHDKPELDPTAVLRESRMMMQGHKLEFFLMMLSFFGWLILGVFTFFVGYLWLIPYIQMTEIKFYESVRAEYEGAADEDGESVVEEPAPVAGETVPEIEEPAPAEEMQETGEITE